MGLFDDRNTNDKGTIIPVWFMRQAGRYHTHYQNIRKNHKFMDMCKNSDLACEITMGPIDDFDYDAAILFSDLLYPLEHLGMGLDYDEGPPNLHTELNSLDVCKQLKPVSPAKEFYNFQKESLEKIKKVLPSNKTLLGFVGSPFTLYTYSVEGKHAGNLISSKQGLYDGRFSAFCELLIPSVLEEMYVQAEGGADAVCIFDTAAGELCVEDFSEFVVPVIKRMTKIFKEKYPNTKITYYSKLTHLNYIDAISCPEIDTIGVDWRVDIAEALNRFGKKHYIQGNMDPAWLFLPWDILEQKALGLYQRVKNSTDNCDHWIFGLGHGVLPKTPESNVRNIVKLVHDQFVY
ncbi:hypothetical protein OAB57_02460 [Bacteriovoracaceae bacterium]|nr:hypothetical protein [Bacteriovoracaceae bacterium]